MPTNTYVALDKVTVGSATPSITFSSIPQGYTDLVVVAGSVTVSNDGYALDFKINGDTGSNYSLTNISGNGSTVRSDRVSNGTNTANDLDYYYGFSSSSPGSVILNFMNYSNSTTYKTVLARSGTAAKQTEASVHLWRSTAAITSIEIGAAGSNIAAGSTFSLYGIAASSVAAKATGGAIYADSTYYYHVFSSTGTFTPSQALSCDVMTIAGGGGGGCDGAGGGGAGGFRVLTSQSLSSGVAYTATIGAGGAGSGSNSFRGFKGSNTTFAGSGLTTISSTGGGGGGSASPVNTGQAGGSGGGARSNSSGAGGSGNEGAYSPVEGYAGASTASSTTAGAGGGGGAGGAGGIGDGTITRGGAGGIGNSSYSSWATATGTGVSGAYAGGGGGGANDTSSESQKGVGTAGGGNGGWQTGVATVGQANTGGGGGGGAYGAGYTDGRAGGSGLIIVRYAKA